jgi:AraC family transcriptional regulator
MRSIAFQSCIIANNRLCTPLRTARLLWGFKPYHFAKQFKRATGLPPHQYVIARRVEQAKQLLRGGDFTLAQVAARAGLSSQRVFTALHFFSLIL